MHFAMATFYDRTIAPRVQRGLLRTAGVPCRVLTDAEVVALTAEGPDFSPAAIMARADAFAAEEAERHAARPPVDDPRSPDELLEEIRRTIEGHADSVEVEVQPSPLLPLPAPLPSLTSALSRRRAIFGAHHA